LESNQYIYTNNLTKHFKDIKAVDGLNINVYKGDIYGFLGPNGAGKSTTIRMLLTLIKPDKGIIKVFNMSLKKNKINTLRNIGALIEKPTFYNYLSAFKNLEILVKYYGINITKNKIFEILELVGLQNRYNSKVKTYSQGMLQRLGLAQTLLHDPDLLILDEPGNGLDPQGTRDIRNLLEYLNKEKNKTILLSSHLLSEIELIANRMIIINNGKAIVEGEVNKLLSVHKLNVTFEVNNVKLAEQIILKNKFTNTIIEKNKNTVKISIGKDKIGSLNKMLINNNIDVYSIYTVRPLEELFIKLTDNK